MRAPALAFTFSYLAYELSQAFPDFLDIFVAYVNERCVLTIPYYPERKPGQSVADQQRALGYVVAATGQAESRSYFFRALVPLLLLICVCVCDSGDSLSAAYEGNYECVCRIYAVADWCAFSLPLWRNVASFDGRIILRCLL